MKTTFLIAAVLLALALTAGNASAVSTCPSSTSTPPTAHFTYSPATPSPGAVVSFDATSSGPGTRTTYFYDGDLQKCVQSTANVAITSYAWDFGDGATATGPAASHSFASPGSYAVKLTVTAGTTGSDTVTNTVRTSWVVTLTQPQTSGFKRATIDLAADAAGPEAITKVAFYAYSPGNGNIAKVGEAATAPYGISFDTSSVPDGPASIWAVAVGAQGGSANSFSRDVTIDNTDPAFTVIEGPSVAKPGDVTFKVRFTDDHGLFGSSFCWADDLNGSNAEYCLLESQDNGRTYVDSYKFNLAAEGDHTLYFEAWDNADNPTVGKAHVRVDGTAPDTTITDADGSSFSFESSEPGSTFRCRVYADGAAAPGFDSCSGDATHTASGLAAGSYRFDVKALDAAGNEDATPASRTFAVEAGAAVQEPQQPQQPQPQGGAAPARSKPGRCAKLRGRKRARCVRRSCAKLHRKKHGAKRYRACVRRVTRKK